MQKNYLFRVMAVAMIFLFSGNWGFGQTIANWTFETSIPTTAGPHTSEVGTGSVLGFHSSASAVYSNPVGNGSVESFSSNFWAVGDYYQFQVSSLSKNDLNFQFDITSSNTGPRDFVVQYSTDGINFTQFGAQFAVLPNVTPNAWTSSAINTIYRNSINLSSVLALNDKSNIYLRLVVNTNVQASGTGTISTAGSSRIDNVIISGTAISTTPELSSISSPSIVEGNSGTTNLTFTATLTARAVGNTVVTLTSTDVSASVGSDFLAIPASVTIPDGQTSGPFDVVINGDTDVETDETFTVTGTLGAISKNGTGTILDDDTPFSPTLISAIQGSGLTSPLVGSTQTIQGIVTRVFTGAGSLNGIYVQEEDTDNDADPTTSEGIFVFNPPIVPAVGALVSITGTVVEFGATNKLTEISPTTSVTIVSTGNPLPTVTNVTLPIANVTEWERYEGMLINVKAATGDLLVTENFELGRYGQVVLAAMDVTTNQPDTDARIDQFTQFNLPGGGYPAYLAAVAKRTIYLDDAKTAQNTDPLLFGRGGMPLSASNTLRTGDAINSVTAVLDHSTDGYKLQTAEPVNFTPANPRPLANPTVGAATLKVGNMNVLNYFNGFIAANCANGDCRGADNATEFTRQRDKILQAIINTDVDVMSLNEIENDGYGTVSSIQNLIDGLNTIQGANSWAFITPSANLSTDAITVGIIYKTAKALPKGASKVYFGGEFSLIVGRGALAQTFEQVSNGAEFTVVSVHFKSKGSSSAGAGNVDSGDGQGNSNGTRTRQAENLRDWLIDPLTGITDPDIIILGDLNSYSKEDPITTLASAGYTTLIPISQYSYQFDGNFGALDHALGTSSLSSQMTGAIKYNINADEPVILDYNTEFKSAGQIISFYNGDMYRSSDHDPVVVGLNLNCDDITFNEISTSACNTYTWANNNQTYTMSGTYIGTTTNCVTEKLILTINTKAPAVISNETICVGGTYTWSVNEQTYNTATSVTVTGVDCAADQILNLTIDNSSCSDAICTTLPADYATSTFEACTPSGNKIGVGVLMSNALNAMPKTFGLMANNRTFTLNTTDISAGNIYIMMAGVSNASSKFGLGGATYSTSTTWPRVPLNASGQLANALFRNAITLFFNLQNSANLGAVPMTNIHHTQPLTECGALTGTGVITSYQMPTVVISYLNNVANGYPATVAGLYALANDALGGKIGLPNLSTIASAMDKINKAFNGCRLISNPSSTPSVFGTGLKVTENSNPYGKGGVYITLIEGDAATGNILGVTEIGSNGISGFDPILNNNYKLILGTDPEGSRIPQAPSGYKIVGEKVTYFNEDQSFAGLSSNGNIDGEIVIGLANINAAKVAAGNKIEVEFLLEHTSPLPVTLISFTGKKQNNTNLLEWKTANEKAFDGFEVHRSDDGKKFEKISFVKGNNSENYQYSDNNLTTNTNFYRLKMIDLDGKFDFSKIIAIQSENVSNTLVGTVYPNPTIDKTAFVEITSENAGIWKLTTFNAMGALQTSNEIQLSKGLNKVSVELNNLSQGIYFLNLENSNGKKFVRKMIKN